MTFAVNDQRILILEVLCRQSTSFMADGNQLGCAVFHGDPIHCLVRHRPIQESAQTAASSVIWRP